MPIKKAIRKIKPMPQGRYAKLTDNFAFKKAFATEQVKYLLCALLNIFLKPKLKHPITKVYIENPYIPGKTKNKREAVLDIHCQDSKKNKFIVEMQMAKQMFFIKRAIFYLCTKVTDSVKKGKEGNDFNFPPIYSLNFLNFDLNFGRGCDNVVQYLSLSNEEQPSVRYDYMHLIFVMLPRFKKTLEECQTLQDKLLYCFRHIHKLKERPKQLREKLFKQLFDILEISRFSNMEYSEYMSRFMAKADRKAQMDYAKTVAGKQGWRKGRKAGIIETAKNMLKERFDLAVIARVTKLPKEEILALR